LDPEVAPVLSERLKQTFQVVAVLSTMLVVGIHYKSDIPDSADASAATGNELAQEFVFGSMGRVAVPLFAFAAGLFYFLSDDGSWAGYRKKLASRVRTVAVPYFLVASIAMTFWFIAGRMDGRAIELPLGQWMTNWILHPPAEQLWFLRDLMVLVTFAPLIRWCGKTASGQTWMITLLAICWAFNIQPFPIVAQWRLLQMETLLFFTLGFVFARKLSWIEHAVHAPTRVIFAGWTVWLSLITVRIYLRADFDLWYASVYSIPDLLLYQLSIVVGSITLLMTAARMRWPWLLNLSGGSFFVYLVHEFPLRAVMHRVSDVVTDHSYSCWILTPLVLVLCYAAAIVMNRYCPAILAAITGGRTPTQSRSLQRTLRLSAQ
jgi:surface polysaccharide O-acyltransferase-like enzyme